MKEIIGIVVEYNPFHNGHLLQIEKIKQMYNNPTIIVIMSGNWTQRGEPSVINKFKKAEIALINGVDLVIELPFYFATSSADIFAEGALKILNELKISHLVFGSENNDVDNLITIAKTMNSKQYESLINIEISKGISYPEASANVINKLNHFKLELPNDVLGLSYIKQIINNNYNIIPVSIKRTNDYHGEELNNHISSATSIRKALSNNLDIKDHVPNNSYSFYDQLHFNEDYFKYLKYEILNNYDNLTKYVDINEEIATRIKNNIHLSNSYDELIKNIKTKRFTYRKIHRLLNHILCNLTNDKKVLLKDEYYIRILGFTKRGQKHLNIIKKDINLPVYSKFKDVYPLRYELQTTMIYNLINNHDDLVQLEYKKELIKK